MPFSRPTSATCARVVHRHRALVQGGREPVHESSASPYRECTAALPNPSRTSPGNQGSSSAQTNPLGERTSQPVRRLGCTPRSPVGAGSVEAGEAV